MLIPTALLPMLMVPLVQAAVPIMRFACGTKGPAPQTLDAIKGLYRADVVSVVRNATDRLTAEQQAGDSSNDATLKELKALDLNEAISKKGGSNRILSDLHKAGILRKRNPVVVDLYIHIVTTVAQQNSVSQTMINDQIQALQRTFGAFSISFNIMPSTRTVNDVWANDGDDLGMKASLRKGGYSALNIYFQSSLGDRTLGRCTLPGPAPPPRSSNFFTDGCNVIIPSMPGGSANGYNMGYTAVHEAGHWFGLLHTFEGETCFGDGDFVVDTPQQGRHTDGCPALGSQDTCPEEGGFDPVNNFMDYSYDFCYTEFTFGQDMRMVDMFNEFRAGN